MENQRTTRGYTLIEIMIAVTIIGTLAAMLVYAVGVVRDRVRIAQAQQDLALLSGAILQLAWDTGDWPSVEPSNYAYRYSNHKHTRRSTTNMTTTTTAELPEVYDLSTSYAGLVATDGVFKGWKGPYLTKIPLDPWGRKYFFDPDYRINTTGEFCQVVGSFGPTKSSDHDWDSDNIYFVVKKKTWGRY